MRDAIDVLRGVAGTTAADLSDDALLRGAVERYLMLLVDQAVAINLHLASALGGPTPRDYTASFAAAASVGALSEELANSLAASAGMRNVLVHEYVRIDLDLVAAAIGQAIEGYGEYVTTVATFVRGLA